MFPSHTRTTPPSPQRTADRATGAVATGAVALLTVACLGVLSACTSAGASAERPRQRSDVASEPVAAFPPDVTTGEVALIDRYANRLVVMDRATGSVTYEENRPQTFEYAFPRGTSDLVTVGSSAGGDYELVRVGPGGVRRVLTLKGRGIFPLAADGTKTYFVVNTYKPDNTVASTSVARLDGSTLTPVPNVTGTVANGVVVDGRLWFTAYDKASDSFTLSSASLADPTAKARVERAGLQNPRLYAYRGEVVVDGRFSAAAKKVDCTIYCLVDSKGGRVYTIQISGENLTLNAVNIESGRRAVLATGDVLDVDPGPAAVTVYLRDGIRTVRPEQLP